MERKRAAVTGPADINREGSDTRRQEDRAAPSPLADHRLAPVSSQPCNQGRLSHIARSGFCVLATNVELQGSDGVECRLVPHQSAASVLTPNKRRPLVLERRLRRESTSRTRSHLRFDESAYSWPDFTRAKCQVN